MSDEVFGRLREFLSNGGKAWLVSGRISNDQAQKLAKQIVRDRKKPK